MRDKNTCAILGEVPIHFPWGYDEEDERCVAIKMLLLQQITYLRTVKGITRFAIAIDSGFALYASEIISGLKQTDAELEMICYVPYEEQATKWTPDLRNRYFEALAASDHVIYLHPTYEDGCEYEAQSAAIKTASIAIAVVNNAPTDPTTAAMLLFIEHQNISVIVIDPDGTIHDAVYF